MSYPGLRVLPSTIRPSDLTGVSVPKDNIDRFGRTIDYLRISITDRCNLRCVYCMPASGVALTPQNELLSFAEIWRVAQAAHALGFVKFRITGGEPLVVKDILSFIHGLRAVTPGATLALTTNGVRLAELAQDLRDAGLSRLNLSLDTLNPDTFRTLARRDDLERVLAGLEAALTANFEQIKINAVIVPGVNEEDLVALASLARELPVDVRFIEQMPLDQSPDSGYLGAAEIVRRLSEHFALQAVAPDDARAAAQMMYTAPELRGRIGVIAPRSRKFCASCNRLRLTPHGELKGCLLSEGTMDLRTPLREGLSDEQLSQLLRYAIGIKPLEYNNDAYGLDRSMSAIGG